MPKLKKENLTLHDLQVYIKDLCKERGWDKNTYAEKFLLFSEEVGELAKAIRNHIRLYSEKERSDKIFELEEEFTDVLNYLIDLANDFDVDLEKAFRKKNKINEHRKWD